MASGAEVEVGVRPRLDPDGAGVGDSSAADAIDRIGADAVPGAVSLPELETYTFFGATAYWIVRVASLALDETTGLTAGAATGLTAAAEMPGGPPRRAETDNAAKATVRKLGTVRVGIRVNRTSVVPLAPTGADMDGWCGCGHGRPDR